MGPQQTNPYSLHPTSPTVLSTECWLEVQASPTFYHTVSPFSQIQVLTSNMNKRIMAFGVHVRVEKTA